MLRSIHQMIVESDSRRLFLVWTMVHFGLSSKKRSSRKPSQSGRFPFRLICGTMTTRPRAMGSLLTRAYDFSLNGTNFWILLWRFWLRESIQIRTSIWLQWKQFFVDRVCLRTFLVLREQKLQISPESIQNSIFSREA